MIKQIIADPADPNYVTVIDDGFNINGEPAYTVLNESFDDSVLATDPLDSMTTLNKYIADPSSPRFFNLPIPIRNEEIPEDWEVKVHQRKNVNEYTRMYIFEAYHRPTWVGQEGSPDYFQKVVVITEEMLNQAEGNGGLSSLLDEVQRKGLHDVVTAITDWKVKYGEDMQSLQRIMRRSLQY